MYKNTTVRYEGHDYEIFWTSQHARHVCANYNQDKQHDIHHEDIARLLVGYDAVIPQYEGRYTFLNWRNPYRGVYEIHVHLARGSRNRPGRCAVLTGYRTNKQQYLYLAAQATRQP